VTVRGAGGSLRRLLSGRARFANDKSTPRPVRSRSRTRLVAQEPVDLLDALQQLQQPTIALYGAKVSTARIVILRSDDEARTFAGAAFGEDKKELHVDFAKEQVVALCWGPRRVDYYFRGGAPWTPMFYSGSPVLRPRRILDLPPVQRVLLRIDRVGSLKKDDARDLTPLTGKELTVEVDRSAAERVINYVVH
jgi:hypothetical protein